MNDYHDRFLANPRGHKTYTDWLENTLENAERNIYELMALEKKYELEVVDLCKCSREFLGAIRKGQNRIAHYKMLELEGYLDQYERK